jgi:hypothetical protein
MIETSKPMTGLLSDRAIRWVQWIACGSALAVFAFCVTKTLHWQIVWDQSVIRYVRFLMSRGLKPYTDITDMNMPGSYLMEALGTAIFGWGDLGWRVYEYVLILVLAACGIILGGRRYWLAGVYGGLIFMLVRLAEGEAFSMERNEVMAMLQVMSMALFFLCLRRRRPVYFGVTSLLVCLAATMKPWGYLLEIFMLAVLVVTLRRHKVPIKDYLLWGVAGNFLMGAGLALFMLREHAFGGFYFVMTKVWPLFRTISPHEQVASHLIPKALLPLLVLAAWSAYRNRAELRWQRASLLLAVVAGAISFKLEGSIVGYHRYVFIAFLALWIGWELSQALRGVQKLSRVIGIVGLILLFGEVAPYYVHLLSGSHYAGRPLESYPANLARDLTLLGGDKLQGQVECLDMLEGCLRALSVDRLVQNTGTTGDMLLFQTGDAPAVHYYHDWYLKTQQRNPANVLVLGNFWFQSDHRTFDKLDAWPDYAAFVREHYVPFTERHFGPGDAPAYRIYLRKGSAVLAENPPVVAP